MKQYQIINAYKSLEKLYAEKLPLKDAFQIYKMKKQLEDSYKFQLEKEQELIQKYNGVMNKTGQIDFGCKDKAAEFMSEIQELNNLESDITIEPITISADLDISISPETIEALAEFITFE